jgi:hypothetical protein
VATVVVAPIVTALIIATIVAAMPIAAIVTIPPVTATVMSIGVASVSGFDDHGRSVVIIGGDTSDNHATDEASNGGDGFIAGPDR